MATYWTDGDTSASETLTDDDHLYPSHINELRTEVDVREADLTTHAADTTTHAATGAVVGTTNTQTLTNKTLTDPTISGLLTVDQNTNAGSIVIDSEATTATALEMDGINTSGTFVNIANAGNQTSGSLVYLTQSHTSTAARVLDIVNAGTKNAIYINQSTVLSSSASFSIYSNVAQTTTTYVGITLDHASSTSNTLLVKNDGTGNGIFIDAESGTALNIDTEVANDGIALDINVAGTSPQPFTVYRNDDVTGNIVLRLGSGYLWVDTNGDLRIHTAAPTSDAGVGTIVGTQS